jgi:hypothetical protein
MMLFDPHDGETPTLGPEGPRTTNWLHHDEVSIVWRPCRWYLALGGACANVMLGGLHAVAPDGDEDVGGTGLGSGD